MDSLISSAPALDYCIVPLQRPGRHLRTTSGAHIVEDADRQMYGQGRRTRTGTSGGGGSAWPPLPLHRNRGIMDSMAGCPGNIMPAIPGGIPGICANRPANTVSHFDGLCFLWCWWWEET